MSIEAPPVQRGPVIRVPEGSTRVRKKRTNRNANLIFSVALLTGSAVGLGWVISNIDDRSTLPSPNETQILPKDFPTPPALSEQEKKVINEVSLTEETKEFGITAMVPFTNLSRENEVGFSLNFQNQTIVAVKENANEDGLWIAISLLGDELTREKLDQKSKNYDGTETELYGYKGMTAWIYFLPDISFLYDTNLDSFSSYERLKTWAKPGKQISFYVEINHNPFQQKYERMNAESYKLLDQNLGKPNDRSDRTFRFEADYAFINFPAITDN